MTQVPINLTLTIDGVAVPATGTIDSSLLPVGPAGGTTPATTLPATIPTSIDATGATDVLAALTTYLQGVPAGSVVVANPTAIYALSGAIKLGGRTNVEFNGQGATLKAIGTGSNENYSLVYFQTFPGTNSGIKFHDWKLTGNVGAGVVAGGAGAFAAAGVLIDGGSNFELYNLTITNVWGDGIEVNSAATGINIHNCSMDQVGRNGISVIYGNGVTFAQNTLGVMGYCAFDVEPNSASQSCFGITINNNTVASWGDAFFALDGSSTGAVFHDISVTNNTCAKSLLSVVTGPGRKKTVTYTGNRGVGTGNVSFAHCDSLTVTGNTGVSVSVNDCPGAITSPNP